MQKEEEGKTPEDHEGKDTFLTEGAAKGEEK